MKIRTLALGLVVVGMSLACGGAGGDGASEPKYGSIELQTYRGGKTTLVFNIGGKVKRTWRNMSGDAVTGTWTQEGEDVTIEWAEASNYKGVRTLYRQTGPCSLTQYRSELSNGKVFDDPIVYERTQPKCDAIQVR